VLLLAFLDWFAIYNKYERINYLTKPATFLALMVWFYTVGGLQGGQMWFGLGLLFSLIGDVMLMLPERFAFWGLLALFSAVMTLFRAEWGACASGLAAAGGALFFGSDFFLLFNRFVQPLANARLWVRISYHLGQLSLAAGVLMHFAIQ